MAFSSGNLRQTFNDLLGVFHVSILVRPKICRIQTHSHHSAPGQISSICRGLSLVSFPQQFAVGSRIALQYLYLDTLSLILTGIHSYGKNHRFRCFNLNNVTFYMITGADLASEFRLPVANIPLQTSGADYCWPPNW